MFKRIDPTLVMIVLAVIVGWVGMTVRAAQSDLEWCDTLRIVHAPDMCYDDHCETCKEFYDDLNQGY